MKTKFQTPYQFKITPLCMEKISDKPSLTEPDLNLSVRQILFKFTHGNLPDIQHDTFSDEKVTFEDYQNYMDKDYDLADMTRDKMRLLEIREQVEEQVKQKQAKKLAIIKAEKKAFEDFKKHKKEATTNTELPQEE